MFWHRLNEAFLGSIWNDESAKHAPNRSWRNRYLVQTTGIWFIMTHDIQDLISRYIKIPDPSTSLAEH